MIDTDNTPDSDISSLESITESLKSEDVFVGGNEDVLRDENEQGMYLHLTTITDWEKYYITFF